MSARPWPPDPGVKGVAQVSSSASGSPRRWPRRHARGRHRLRVRRLSVPAAATNAQSSRGQPADREQHDHHHDADHHHCGGDRRMPRRAHPGLQVAVPVSRCTTVHAFPWLRSPAASARRESASSHRYASIPPRRGRLPTGTTRELLAQVWLEVQAGRVEQRAPGGQFRTATAVHGRNPACECRDSRHRVVLGGISAVMSGLRSR